MEGLSVIVPVYNEASEVGKVIDELLALPFNRNSYEIIVVNDASTDESAQIINSRTGIVKLANDVNSGYGASLKKGILNARFDKIAICDADNTYPAEELPRLLRYMDKCDMIVGKRNEIIYPRFNFFKQLGRIMIDCLCSYLAGAWIPDINSGFRIFKKDVALKYMEYLCDRFSFTTSITLIMFTNGYRVKYTGIDYCTAGSKRQSKVKMVRDGFKTLKIILGLGFIFEKMKTLLLAVLAAVAAAVLVNIF